ncbi:PDZ domain-containing protein [Cordyceps javanica]|uniref:Pro-apoptotic serine protease NMA111 n=1 Tax=Cordyceps javanica TaxID=43265 RepID=A0A545UM18_9HYPO|nr:PDZ domain-containing protein [Cordyceps javanica]
MSTFSTEPRTASQSSSVYFASPTTLGHTTSGARSSSWTLTLASALSRTAHSTATADVTSQSRQDGASGSVSTSRTPWAATTALPPASASKPQTAMHAVAVDANTTVESSLPAATPSTPSPAGTRADVAENLTTAGAAVTGRCRREARYCSQAKQKLHLRFPMALTKHEATAICSAAGNMLCEALRRAFRRRPARSPGRPAHQSRKHSYILTNRHVAGPGPFWGLCIFGQEAVSCRPLYIDPIHDFVFLKYDPEGIQNATIDGLGLSPHGATVGQPLLVVGNDAGEATSIIDGAISRTDRNAPEYDGPYSDFNISYYMANMNLSGGISGSPALGEDGLVLGMVSGGMTDGAICFILPAGPLLQTLHRLRQGRHVPRGDIQCRFTMKALHECKGLGLNADWEARSRKPITTSGGLLVAEKVLPGGPSCGRILPGDILLEVNGAAVLQFDELERVFNENVDDQVSVSLLRNGVLVLGIINVINLYNVTPKRVVSFAGLFCHDVSYVQAVNASVAASGVYVAESMGPLMIGDGEPGWVIHSLNGQVIHSLEEFLDRLTMFHKGQSVVVTYARLESLYRRSASVLTLYAPGGIRVFSEDEATGLWRSATMHLRPLPPPSTRIDYMNKISPHARCPAILASLVHVESRAYLSLDGYPATLARGMGVIVVAGAGLVVVSRKVVPHKACYVRITFGASAEAEARCVFLHAHHCYAIVQYDALSAPGGVGGVTLDERRLHGGSEASLLYFSGPEQLLQGDAVERSVVLTRPAPRPNTPSLRCQPVNADLLGIEVPSEVQSADGVVVSSDGLVQAIWMPGIGGLTAASLSGVLSRFAPDSIPDLHVMPAEMEVISMRQARIVDVPEEFIRSVAESPCTSSIFMVKRTLTTQLREGDVVLAVDDTLPTCWADFEVSDPRTIPIRLWRQGVVQDIGLETIRVDDLETTRCVELCGACIQPTPLTVRHWLGPDQAHDGRDVYFTDVRAGSTAALYSLPGKTFITKINGEALRDFDAFVAVAKSLSDGRVFTVTTVTLNGREDVCGLQVNEEHHPLAEWTFNGAEPPTDNQLPRQKSVSFADVTKAAARQAPGDVRIAPTRRQPVAASNYADRRILLRLKERSSFFEKNSFQIRLALKEKLALDTHDIQDITPTTTGWALTARNEQIQKKIIESQGIWGLSVDLDTAEKHLTWHTYLIKDFPSELRSYDDSILDFEKTIGEEIFAQTGQTSVQWRRSSRPSIDPTKTTLIISFDRPVRGNFRLLGLGRTLSA